MDKEQKRLTTGSLLNRLLHTASFARFQSRYAAELDVPSLPHYLDDLCRACGASHESIILRSGLDRVYGHQIFCGRKRPSRDKVLQLAFGFQLNPEQTQQLLRAAGKSPLYPRLERDAALLFCLHNRKSVMEAQWMLSDLHLPVLGGGCGYD